MVDESATNILTGEAFVNEDDLEQTFRELIDDAAYNLKRDFNITMTPAEIANTVISAMKKYKSFR